MNEKIYREKALSKINSPEELNDVICVTNPSVWLIVIALIVLLIGSLCWGIWGEVETTIPVTFFNKGNKFVTTMSMYEARNITIGTPARVGPHPCNITAANLDEDSYTLELEVNLTLPFVETMSGEIITSSVHPIQFLLN